VLVQEALPVNISITFRHMDASVAIKAYASDKVAKLQKFLRQPMTAKVTLSLDKLLHVAETRISSGGAHLEAKESSDDMYASIDKVIDKLERQIRGTKGVALSKKRRSGDSLRGTQVLGEASAAMPEPPAPRRAKAKTNNKSKPSSARTKAGGAQR
jgi:putative sigma-54 modulation protein